MADLDFRHNVQEIPAGAQLPPPVRRSVTADVTPQPDVQSAISNYAANTNWMRKFWSTGFKSTSACPPTTGYGPTFCRHAVLRV